MGPVLSARLSLRGGGWGLPLAPMNVAPSNHISKENRRKIEPKETPSCLISRLLVVFTWQLETLVTTLLIISVHLIENKEQEVKKGRDQLWLSLLQRCPSSCWLRESS